MSYPRIKGLYSNGLKASWELEVVFTPKAPWLKYTKPVSHTWPRIAMNVVQWKQWTYTNTMSFFWWFSSYCSTMYFLSVNLVGDNMAFWCQKLGFTTLGLLLRTNWRKWFCKRLSWMLEVLKINQEGCSLTSSRAHKESTTGLIFFWLYSPMSFSTTPRMRPERPCLKSRLRSENPAMTLFSSYSLMGFTFSTCHHCN